MKFVGFVLALGAASAFAQPKVIAVTNTADYTPTLSPGSIASIFGTGLALSSAGANTIPLPTTLNNVTVTVGGVEAPLFFVSPLQINFQVPFETRAGSPAIVVKNGSARSSSVQVPVSAFSLGIFGDGTGHSVAQNIDQSVNSAAHPAASGTDLVVYATGLGVTDTKLADGTLSPGSPAAKFAGTATATIGDVNAPVDFAGMTPGSVGLAQVNIRTPALPTGNYPLQISLNGFQSASALVSVKGTGSGFQVSNILTLVSSFSLPGLGPTFVPGISGVVDNSLALYKNTLYICSPSDINVVDVTNPAAPNYLLNIKDAQFYKSAHNCTVNDQATKPFLNELIRATQSITLYDLSNPAAPMLESRASLPVLPRAVAYSGSAGFFGEDLFSYSGHNVDTTRGKISWVDFTNPKAPAVGPVVPSNPQHPETNPANLRTQMVVPTPDVLYAASTTAAQTFDNGVGALDIFTSPIRKSFKASGKCRFPERKCCLR